tara:strand:+ start:54 stop:605 length:552 start_codon:yes stop_codon:yes gene_type:complete
MRLFFLSTLLMFLLGCSKPKTVLICGDHICVNKLEAQQYFEENLSLEVKIVKKTRKKNIDLVELNLREGIDGNKEIGILSKERTTKNLKVLSSKEIKDIKNKIKTKKENKKIKRKITKNTSKDIFIDEKKISKNRVNEGVVSKNKLDVYDVCLELENCNIDEISKFLIKMGKKKNFPDITKRQ